MGLAQIRRLPRFLEIQRRNHAALAAALADVPGVTFRRVPDPAGDSGTFVSFLLPEEGKARAAAKAMQAAGIPAMYWFDNNWHYLRRWDHLKDAASPYPLPGETARVLRGLRERPFPASDAVMSRVIYTPVGLAWSEAQLAERAAKLAAAVRGA